jgi:hypothetical protein
MTMDDSMATISSGFDDVPSIKFAVDYNNVMFSSESGAKFIC